MKSKTKKVADMAMFLAVGVVLNMISFPIVGGFGRASFVYLFCYTVGIFLGPFSGFAVAFLGDLIPALLFPQGPWIPLISISIGLMAFFSGMCYRYIKLGFGVRLSIAVLLCYLVCTLVLTPLGEVMLFDLYPYTFAKTLGKALGITSPYLMLALSKGLTQLFWIGINSAGTYFLCKALFKMKRNQYLLIPFEAGKKEKIKKPLKHC